MAREDWERPAMLPDDKPDYDCLECDGLFLGSGMNWRRKHIGIGKNWLCDSCLDKKLEGEKDEN